MFTQFALTYVCVCKRERSPNVVHNSYVKKRNCLDFSRVEHKQIIHALAHRILWKRTVRDLSLSISLEWMNNEKSNNVIINKTLTSIFCAVSVSTVWWWSLLCLFLSIAKHFCSDCSIALEIFYYSDSGSIQFEFNIQSNIIKIKILRNKIKQV